MNFDRWVALDALLLGEAFPVERKDEYECAFPTAAGRPFVSALVAVPVAFPSLVILFRDTTRLGSAEEGGVPSCSNFFFMSLTLARAVVGTALPVADRNLAVLSLPAPEGLLVNLSSTGLETERWGVLVAARVPGGGGLAGVPFPFPFAFAFACPFPFPRLMEVDRAGGV